MKYKVSVTKTFSAAHALREYKGRCENLHGHNWKVRVSLSGDKLNNIGMIVDFSEIKISLENILTKLDHKHLNEVEPFIKTNPTAENIAAFIFNETKKVFTNLSAEVEVWESETSSAAICD